ncbi:putative glutamyl-tRNA amidotransferase subunit A [Rhodotorula diobovata]|uniref:Putative glutamyl-tRNA amidotransferase subunit A n=1 Tax=Rhodotorula diobovata TaxID=5288 RepID=A0A5C5FUE7_9BASI|nr:putative glutamyl-tRNA amidotransferase subunit A [Rhodotorula diobovata]
MTWDGSLAISALQAAYASGTTTPTEVARAVHERLTAYAALDPAVWIDVVPLEALLARAAELEEAYEGRDKPALFGVPMSVKNSIDVAGFKTTLACPDFAYVPEKTAPAVERALEAGALLVGTTNLDQFATGLVGHRSPYGTPRCVYDREYISGGSSSGSAVSVGAKLVSFSIGTDTAGSTRVPASFNGLVGLKPTLYSISAVGLVPACKLADCVTVLATSVDDARQVYDVLRGYDPDDSLARPYEKIVAGLVPWREEGVRFATPPEELLGVLSAPYAKLYKQAVDRLERGGLQRAEGFSYEPAEEANNMLYGSSIVAQRLVAFDDYLTTHGTSTMHPVVASIFSASSGFSAVRAYQDLFLLASQKRRVELEFEKADVLVVPSTVTHWKVAEVDEDPLGRNKVLGSFTHFVNLVDLCAISVPAGTWTNDSGNEMPFGLTFVAPAGRDAEIMRLAERFAEMQ